MRLNEKSRTHTACTNLALPNLKLVITVLLALVLNLSGFSFANGPVAELPTATEAPAPAVFTVEYALPAPLSAGGSLTVFPQSGLLDHPDVSFDVQLTGANDAVLVTLWGLNELPDANWAVVEAVDAEGNVVDVKLVVSDQGNVETLVLEH